ncbi:MAG: hypothetical protein B9S33_03625 [Pedosphaera sp. Tous-C6FEB]|nr:MAG: hypothetical protein B9S33_03625 [Pedosphaera sp. Tous-C6FEB]
MLNGLAELSSKGAKALAEHEGDLTLEGLASLTANAASALASHNGRLFINVAELSDDAAKELCNPKGEVFGTICGQDAEEFLKQFKS